MFVTHGLALAGVGVAIGLAVAVGVMRLMSSLLFEVSPIDPLTYALVVADADRRDRAGELRARPARDDGGSDQRAESGVDSRATCYVLRCYVLTRATCYVPVRTCDVLRLRPAVRRSDVRQSRAFRLKASHACQRMARRTSHAARRT